MRKFLSIALATVMLVACLVPAFTLSAESSVALSVADSEVYDTETSASVDISIKENPGVSRLVFALYYKDAEISVAPSAVTYASFAPASSARAYPGTNRTYKSKLESLGLVAEEYRVLVITLGAGENDDGDALNFSTTGVAASVPFSFKNAITAGDKFEYGMFAISANIIDNDSGEENEVAVSDAASTATVTCVTDPFKRDDYTLIADVVSVDVATKKAVVDVRLAGNSESSHGIWGLNYYMITPSDVKVVSVNGRTYPEESVTIPEKTVWDQTSDVVVGKFNDNIKDWFCSECAASIDESVTGFFYDLKDTSVVIPVYENPDDTSSAIIGYKCVQHNRDLEFVVNHNDYAGQAYEKNNIPDDYTLTTFVATSADVSDNKKSNGLISRVEVQLPDDAAIGSSYPFILVIESATYDSGSAGSIEFAPAIAIENGQIELNCEHPSTHPVKVEPSCETDGAEQQVCDVCGVAVSSTPIPHLGHDMVAGTVVPGNCHAEGYTIYTCQRANCDVPGYTEQRDKTPKDANNHDGDTEVRNAKPATCKVPGYTGDTYCLGCGEKIATGTKIDALGHSYTREVVSDATLRTPADYTQAATYWYTCERCDDVSDTLYFSYGEPLHYVVDPVNGNKFVKDSKDGLVIKVDGDINKFVGISIDGTQLSADDIVFDENAMTFTISPNALNKLTAGDHTLTVAYNDASASITIKIEDANVQPPTPTPTPTPAPDTTADSGKTPNKSPATGDSAFIVICVVVALMGTAIVATIVVPKIVRKKTR